MEGSSSRSCNSSNSSSNNPAYAVLGKNPGHEVIDEGDMEMGIERCYQAANTNFENTISNEDWKDMLESSSSSDSVDIEFVGDNMLQQPINESHNLCKGKESNLLLQFHYMKYHNSIKLIFQSIILILLYIRPIIRQQ